MVLRERHSEILKLISLFLEIFLFFIKPVVHPV